MPKSLRTKEIMSLVYKRSGSCLYGYIRFFKSPAKNKPPKLHRQSAPFVISQLIGENETVFHGSVYELTWEIRRLINDLQECQTRFDLTLCQRGVVTDSKTDSSGKTVFVSIPDGDKENRLFFDYIREVTNVLLLIAFRMRNLLEIFPRLAKYCIDMLDYEGNKKYSVTLKELCDYFAHNRYLFVDGEYITDIFSDKFPKDSPVSKTFMGYKINWTEYVASIKEIADDVRIKDLTQLLRGRLKKLSTDSSHKDVVFLVQNLESFSHLLDEKIQDERYKDILDLLFSERIHQYVPDLDVPDLAVGEQVVEQTIAFKAPHIKIHEDLSSRKFTIQVQCSFALRHNDKDIYREEELKKRSMDIDYREFLQCVNKAFGNDPLLPTS